MKATVPQEADAKERAVEADKSIGSGSGVQESL